MSLRRDPSVVHTSRMATKPPLILIVDDNPDQLRILSEMLRSAGYDVASSNGGETGLRKAKTLNPDLVLTDLAMPYMSGVQLIERLRADADTADLPIIAVTAYAWHPIAQAASSAGADSVLSKPYTRAKLVEEIELRLGTKR